MRDPKSRFTGIAETYARFRPSYPDEMADWVLARSGVGPGDPAADIGCGTGISTRLFFERGLSVVGIDPNDDMLAAARLSGRARYQKGEASVTGLGAAAVSLVVGGQSFHWFELGAAMPEFRRILKPGGWCAAFWNQRAPGPVQDDYEALLRGHCAEYENFSKGSDTLSRIAAFPGVVDFARAEFANIPSLDREAFVGRAYSSSYVARGLKDKGGFDRGLAAIFDKHQRGGALVFPYRALAGIWRFAP